MYLAKNKYSGQVNPGIKLEVENKDTGCCKGKCFS
jgi:hypothetical protein